MSEHETHLDWLNSLDPMDAKLADILWDDTGRPHTNPSMMFEVILNNCDTKSEWKRRFDLFFKEDISINGDALSDVLWDIYEAGMYRLSHEWKKRNT